MHADPPRRSPTSSVVGIEHRLQLLEAALEVAANPILISKRDGTIIWVNKPFEHLSGYTRDEALGQNTRLLKSGKQSPDFYEAMWQTILSGRKWRGELVNRHKDGSFYTEMMTITPVGNPSGDITYFIASKLNTNERNLPEDQLAASGKIAITDRLPHEFAFTIKNILSVIEGYCELAAEGLLSDDPRNLHLENIKKACRRAAALARQELAING